MSKSRNTYSTMAMWLKWASLIILLIPATIFGLAIAQYYDKLSMDVLNKTGSILWIILLVLTVAWAILNILLFFTAGTVKSKVSPTLIRIGLITSFVFVFAPEITSVLMTLPYDHPIIEPDNKVANMVVLFMPLIVAIGYIIGHGCARQAQRKTA